MRIPFSDKFSDLSETAKLSALRWSKKENGTAKKEKERGKGNGNEFKYNYVNSGSTEHSINNISLTYPENRKKEKKKNLEFE